MGSDGRYIRNKYLSVIFKVTIFSVIIGSGCPRGNYLNVKLKVTEPVSAGDSVWLWCETERSVAAKLDFRWTCTRGKIVYTAGDSARWLAPESSGQAAVKVKVVDLYGNSSEDSVIVAVKQKSVVFADWEGMVKSGEYVFYFDSLQANYRLEGQCRGDTGNTLLIFLDENNFYKWKNQIQYEFLIRKYIYNAAPFVETIPRTGIYYLVLDNTRTFTDCAFWVSVVLRSP